ncbi:MAG: hypothetical protein JW751_20465 [Polyangiaceae bacterium]|nr:hypothetical protein [Polyangiaceae bacterium]
MSVLSLVTSLIVVVVLLWLINGYIPMDGTLKKILNVVIVVSAVVWLLAGSGVLGGVAMPFARMGGRQSSGGSAPRSASTPTRWSAC